MLGDVAFKLIDQANRPLIGRQVLAPLPFAAFPVVVLSSAIAACSGIGRVMQHFQNGCLFGDSPLNLRKMVTLGILAERHFNLVLCEITEQPAG